MHVSGESISQRSAADCEEKPTLAPFILKYFASLTTELEEKRKAMFLHNSLTHRDTLRHPTPRIPYSYYYSYYSYYYYVTKSVQWPYLGNQA